MREQFSTYATKYESPFVCFLAEQIADTDWGTIDEYGWFGRVGRHVIREDSNGFVDRPTRLPEATDEAFFAYLKDEGPYFAGWDECCIDCGCLIANDDDAPDDDETAAGARRNALAGYTADNGHAIVDGEITFSRTPCAVCRTRLHGARFYVIGLGR